LLLEKIPKQRIRLIDTKKNEPVLKQSLKYAPLFPVPIFHRQSLSV